MSSIPPDIYVNVDALFHLRLQRLSNSTSKVVSISYGDLRTIILNQREI
jgi:hypothetical protein